MPELPERPEETEERVTANLGDDKGMPQHLAYWGIGVGLVIAFGGATLLVFFGLQVPAQYAALTLCVGFGIVLAAFGSRAAGMQSGFAVVGAGALALLLFLTLEYFSPKDPAAFVKRGILDGDFSKVADLRIVDEDPLYTRQDRTTRSLRFIVLDHTFRTQQIFIQVDTTEKGEGREFFQMVGDGQRLAQRYLASDRSVIKWEFDYARRLVRDGSSVIFNVPEDLNEEIVGGRRQTLNIYRPFQLISTALAADEPIDPSSLIQSLTSDDATTRRNARDRLAGLGVSAVAPMMTALRNAPDDYRLKTGVVLSLSDILSSNESLRGEISKQLTAADIAVLVASAASDKDPTIRLQATDFLYRLKDPRSVDPALGNVKNASDEHAAYNSTLIIKGTAPSLSDSEQKRVDVELGASKGVSSPAGNRTNELINSVRRALGMHF